MVQLGLLIRLVTFAGLLVTLTSCRWASVNPLVKQDHAAFTQVAAMTALNRNLSSTGVQNVGAASERRLTIENCRRIGLANNLSMQTSKLDELAKTDLSLGEWAKMFPHAIMSAKFDEGDNILYSDIEGDSYWAGFYERSAWRFFLEARWSPTDAALAYYLAKNGENRILESRYETTRVAQKIIEAVEVAFFRLLSIQECLPLASKLVSMREQVSGELRDLTQEKLVSMADYHRAMHAEMNARSILSQLTSDAERQRTQLLAAMGLTRNCEISGASLVVSGELKSSSKPYDVKDAELEALKNRPEAYRAGLKHFDSINEFRKSIVKNFPRVNLFWRYLNDRYTHPYDKTKQQAGILFYFDVSEWLTNFAESRAASRGAVKTEKEAVVVALAIASQARIAAAKYLWALEQVGIKEHSLCSSRTLLEVAKHRADSDDLDKLAEKQARADTILANIEWLRTLGEANISLAELQCVTGRNYKMGW